MNAHYIEKKIYYHDTDCGGVVYYANYLKYLEEGRSEYFLNKGVSLKELAKEGIYFVVAHTELDYKSPAHYQDILKVYTGVTKTGKCSIDFFQEVNRENEVLVQAKTTLVCINKDVKPISLPLDIKEKL